MKIQLEHRLSSCPDKLRCTVCQQVFTVGKIRPLLVNQRGWIQGDLCPECVSLPADEIRLILADQAWLMVQQPQLFQPRIESPETLAMELFEVSLEKIKMPSLYQWWIKMLESQFVRPDEDQVTIEAIAALTHSPWHHYSP
jgi:hypothetical protein